MTALEREQFIDRLRQLRSGEDIGRQRTWPEVGAVVGMSACNVRRLATGATRFPKHVVDYDPRPFLGDMNPEISDEVIAAWREHHTCLCGCGTVTSRSTGGKGRPPSGGYLLFARGHQKRTMYHRQRSALIGSDPDLHRRAAATITANRGTMSTGMLRDILQEWLAADPSRTQTGLARKAGVAQSVVWEVHCGYKTRVMPLTYARLLRAMDEPLRPELETLLREHRRRAA